MAKSSSSDNHNSHLYPLYILHIERERRTYQRMYGKGKLEVPSFVEWYEMDERSSSS